MAVGSPLPPSAPTPCWGREGVGQIRSVRLRALLAPLQARGVRVLVATEALHDPAGEVLAELGVLAVQYAEEEDATLLCARAGIAPVVALAELGGGGPPEACVGHCQRVEITRLMDQQYTVFHGIEAAGSSEPYRGPKCDGGKEDRGGGGGGGEDSYAADYAVESYGEDTVAAEGYGSADEGAGGEEWAQHAAEDGTPFWYNAVSGESVWEDPYAEAGAGPAAAGQEEAEGDWAEYADDDGNPYWYSASTGEYYDDDGNAYYYNAETGESTYERPAELG